MKSKSLVDLFQIGVIVIASLSLIKIIPPAFDFISTQWQQDAQAVPQDMPPVKPGQSDGR